MRRGLNLTSEKLSDDLVPNIRTDKGREERGKEGEKSIVVLFLGMIGHRSKALCCLYQYT